MSETPAQNPSADASSQVTSSMADSRSRPSPSSDPDAAASNPVAAALGKLSALDAAELSDHPELYQQIHGELQAALAEIDVD